MIHDVITESLPLLAAVALSLAGALLFGFYLLQGLRRPRAVPPASAPPPPAAGSAVLVSPVYRRKTGALVGFLRRHDPESQYITFQTGVKLVRMRNFWFTDAGPKALAELPKEIFRAVVLLLALLLIPAASRAADFPAASLSQLHHPRLAAGAQVCAVGFVESTRHERDEDVHVWLCPSPARRSMPERRQECVLGEIVPGRPMPRPAHGLRVRMCGRWIEADMPHGWTELHPVERIEVAP